MVQSLKRNLKQVQQKVEKLEKRLLGLVKKNHQILLTQLKSMPGVGPKTALMLVVLTDGFERFNSASQLCSYAGLTPVIRQSGTSVHSRARITKIGNQKLRNLLFMCSFNACKPAWPARQVQQSLS